MNYRNLWLLHIQIMEHERDSVFGSKVVNSVPFLPILVGTFNSSRNIPEFGWDVTRTP